MHQSHLEPDFLPKPGAVLPDILEIAGHDNANTGSEYPGYHH